MRFCRVDLFFPVLTLDEKINPAFYIKGISLYHKCDLLFLLLMSILSQSFLTLMRRDFMSFSFFTARHNKIFLD